MFHWRDRSFKIDRQMYLRFRLLRIRLRNPGRGLVRTLLDSKEGSGKVENPESSETNHSRSSGQSRVRFLRSSSQNFGRCHWCIYHPSKKTKTLLCCYLILTLFQMICCWRKSFLLCFDAPFVILIWLFLLLYLIALPFKQLFYN